LWIIWHNTDRFPKSHSAMRYSNCSTDTSSHLQARSNSKDRQEMEAWDSEPCHGLPRYLLNTSPRFIRVIRWT
jgi:hypothetical protein